MTNAVPWLMVSLPVVRGPQFHGAPPSAILAHWAVNMTRNIKELSPEVLGAWLAAEGQAPYRARQILQWIYQKGAESFAAMSDLPNALRARHGMGLVAQRLDSVANGLHLFVRGVGPHNY